MGIFQYFHFICINQLEFFYKELYLNCLVILKYILSPTWRGGGGNWGADAVMKMVYLSLWDQEMQTSRRKSQKDYQSADILPALWWMTDRIYQLENQRKDIKILGDYQEVLCGPP